MDWLAANPVWWNQLLLLALIATPFYWWWEHHQKKKRELQEKQMEDRARARYAAMTPAERDAAAKKKAADLLDRWKREKGRKG